MKYFAEFYEVSNTKWSKEEKGYIQCKPYYYAPCGSDRMFILDGRNNHNTMISDCKERLSKKNRYKGFKVYEGNFREARVIYSYLPAIK